MLWLLEEGGELSLSLIGPELRRKFPDLPDAALIPAVVDAIEGLCKLGLVHLKRPREAGSRLWEEIPEEEELIVLAEHEDMWAEWAAARWDYPWASTVARYGDSVRVYLVLTQVGRRLLDTQVRLPPEVQ